MPISPVNCGADVATIATEKAGKGIQDLRTRIENERGRWRKSTLPVCRRVEDQHDLGQGRVLQDL